MLDDRYVAGLFDGEGCVHIQPNCQVKVYITQKDPMILYLLEKQYGGHVYKNGDHYHLQFGKRVYTEPFLKAIQPHSIIKRGKIELALQMFPLFRQGRENGFPVPPEKWKQRLAIRDRIRNI